MFKYTEIGKILKSIHSDGEMITSIQIDFIDDIQASKAIFIEIDGLNIPFFIENIECEKDLCYIKLEEFSNPEDVKTYNNSIISLRETDINWESKSKNKITNNNEFIGFSIFDLNSEQTYIIEDIEQFPHQLMAKIKSDNKKNELFIPLIEEFIESINLPEKKITMSLPEGIA